MGIYRGYDYVYQYKDHLGNVRLSYTEDPSNPGSPTIIEENNYFPFGGLHKGYNNGGDNALGNDLAQKWKYNGKELQEDLSLELYDYGARSYDPWIGRWTSVDPMANLYYDNSPYNFVKNDPILYFDVDGNFRLSKADQNKYKALSNFLKNDIQKLLDNEEILQGIMKFTGATEEQIRKDFKWDSGPLVTFGKMKTAGVTLFSDRIELAENIAEGSKTSKKYLLFAILTLLHEDIHALGIETGLINDWEFYDKYGEEGYAFEIEVFGRISSLSDGSFAKVLEELGIEDGKPDDNEEGRQAVLDFFNDFSNLEEGKYEWNGKRFVKID